MERQVAGLLPTYILVVDDDPEIRDLVANCVVTSTVDLDVAVHSAASFEAAMDGIYKFAPDVVITDFHLRGYGDCLGALVAERAVMTNEHCRVLLQSGAFSSRDISEWEEKPYITRAQAKNSNMWQGIKDFVRGR